MVIENKNYQYLRPGEFFESFFFVNFYMVSLHVFDNDIEETGLSVIFPYFSHYNLRS